MEYYYSPHAFVLVRCPGPDFFFSHILTFYCFSILHSQSNNNSIFFLNLEIGLRLFLSQHRLSVAIFSISLDALFFLSQSLKSVIFPLSAVPPLISFLPSLSCDLLSPQDSCPSIFCQLGSNLDGVFN
jgi:hypothetical protein